MYRFKEDISINCKDFTVMNNNRFFSLMLLLLSIVTQPYTQTSSQVLNVGQPVNPIVGMSSSSPDIQIKQQTPVAGGKKHPYNS